ncbi:hypothetical protein ECDEC12E_5304 [Escherichia coli DEC12E]|nr:hypothetical protein ECDEC12E_5304 [Escherichia coli DEC12E]
MSNPNQLTQSSEILSRQAGHFVQFSFNFTVHCDYNLNKMDFMSNDFSQMLQ